MMKIDRTGERRLMNCGEYATIIRYGGYTDIDVRFDSGEVAQSKVYSNFISGSIAKPVPNRVGERRLMNCGEYATIIRYDGYTDIDVRFDSGEIIRNRSYKSFITGGIRRKVNRIGERRLMNCGEYATIVRYGSYRDIDIQFDNSEKIKHRTYFDFKRGVISKPIRNRIGDRHLMNCGEYATIIRYNNSSDVDVKFDSGEIVYNRTYNNFIKGSISKPKVSERKLMNCGLYATIIRYNNATDIDINFESGDIINAYDYSSFNKGYCKPLWYNQYKMKSCYYDKVINDVIILMKDGTVLRKSKLFGGIVDEN